MKVNRMKRRILTALLLGVALILSALPVSAAGPGKIDMEKPVSLTVRYRDNETPLVNAEFDLYYVAAVDSRCEVFTLTSGFEAYADVVTNLNNLAHLTQEEWTALAGDLNALIQSEGLTPFDSGATGTDGTLPFPSSGKTMEKGLYLILGQKCTQDGYDYYAMPTFVMVPNQVPDGENIKWEYDVTAEPKKEKEKEEITTVSITVTKKWNNLGVRPDSIHPAQAVAYLFNETGFVERVTLSAANNWTYVWNDLSSEHNWFVTEMPVTGYTYSISRFGNVFVITNTYIIPPPPPPIIIVTTEPPVTEPPVTEPPETVTNPPETETQPPETETKPPETETQPPETETQPPETEPPVTETETTEPETEPVPPQEELPQTGVLWWPVPILAAVGIALIIVGVELRKKKSV